VPLRLEDADLAVYLDDALDRLQRLPDGCCDGVVTSPPYLDQRDDYDAITAEGLADTLLEAARVCGGGPLLVNVGRIWRDGREVQWWMPALDLLAERGVLLLDTLIWVKPNANPLHGHTFIDSHEYVLLLGHRGIKPDVTEIRTEYSAETLARMDRAYHNSVRVKGDSKPRVGRKPHEDGARPRSFVHVYTGEGGNEHPAPMPLGLADYLVKIAAPAGGTVLDPYAGSGTTGEAARRQGRRGVLIEIRPDYCDLIEKRLAQLSLLAL
jgi:site-specific DNA-methyltransferase (adenine-specific)